MNGEDVTGIEVYSCDAKTIKLIASKNNMSTADVVLFLMEHMTETMRENNLKI